MVTRKWFLLLLAMAAVPALFCQPKPESPRVYIDTSYHHPSASTINVRSGEDLQVALDAAQPGDTVVVEAGATFTGNFMLPPKASSGWIYIETSAINSMPPPGQRPTPGGASHMPKIQTPNSMPALLVLPGAAHYRLVGLEITPAAGAPRVYQLVNIDFVASRVEAQLHSLAQQVVPGLAKDDNFPRNITIDRCYIHGSDTQDVREGIVANGIAVAVIDSYISDIHDSTLDSQGILVYRTPGPIKIVNNLISATTENVMFGGAGAATNPYVPSDIEIRRNWFYKPLSWIALTTNGSARWSVKNNLEFKNAQRVVVTGNILENAWQNAQNGCSLLLTVRTSDSGNSAVVDDITVENNILKNVNSGFCSVEHDDLCNPRVAPNCTNPGEAKRWKIANNLILLRDANAPGGFRPTGLNVAEGLADVIFQHNTVVAASRTDCYASLYFNVQQGLAWPLKRSDTQNLWILDNVLCRQPTGDWGGQGTDGLTSYMGDPSPLAPRYSGNVMYVPRGDKVQVFPRHNLSTATPITYIDPAAPNYQLASPKWAQTTDGSVAGINTDSLNAAMNPESMSSVLLQPQVVTLEPGQTVQFVSPFSNSSWSLTPPTGRVTARGFYTAPKGVSGLTSVTLCATSSGSSPLCASIVLHGSANSTTGRGSVLKRRDIAGHQVGMLLKR